MSWPLAFGFWWPLESPAADLAAEADKVNFVHPARSVMGTGNLEVCIQGMYNPVRVVLVGGIPTPLKNIRVRQWEGLSHTLWKIKNVPNHQPE